MKKEIVLIDDDLIYRMIIKKIIKDIDPSIVITECEDGEIGLNEIQNLKDSLNKIIVLLDINMPITDGWHFLDEIENSNLYNTSQLIIYMVTSSIDEMDIERSKSYETIKGFYSKPLTKADLEEIISST